MRVRAACVVALVLSLMGCGSPEEPPPAPTPDERLAELKARLNSDPLDPWRYYELAVFHDEQGQIDWAIRRYGEAINKLPPRAWTSPMLRLGKLHQRLGNDEAAARCFDEVLATTTGDSQRYRTNPDFRDAALGLKVILEARGDPAEAERLAALRERFLGELGGTEEAWARRPGWLPPPPGQ